MATLNLSPNVLKLMERRKNRIAVRQPAPEQPVIRRPNVAVRTLIHDLDFGSYSLGLVFWKVDGEQGTVIIPRSLTASPQDVVKQLLDAGALLPGDKKAAVELVQASLARPARRERATTLRGGWRDASFVTRGNTFGPQASRLSLINSAAYEDPSIGMRHGTFEGWREGIRAACEASSFLTFGLGIGFAGPLLEPLGEDEGAIFNFYGETSTGKTLVARCLHSQAGRAQKSDLTTYDITPRGAEELCFARNDWAVTFDEQSRTTGSPTTRREKIRAIAFMVPSGRGAIRSTKVARGHQDLPNLSWRVFGLSSGEKPLEDPGTRRVGGEQLRHVDIMIPKSGKGGIFDLIDEGGEEFGRATADLADAVETTIDSNYGLARDRYLERLVAERSRVQADARDLVDRFVDQVGAGPQAWERRLARKFGIVAAGATSAAKWGVAPFPPEHAWACVLQVYRVARRSIFSVQDQTDNVLHALREARDQGRFPLLQKGEVLRDEDRETAWGFRRQSEGREIVAVLPEKFDALAPSRPSAVAVHDTLIEKGVALRDPDGKRHRQIAVNGFPRAGRGRWVCLLASKL